VKKPEGTKVAKRPRALRLFHGSLLSIGVPARAGPRAPTRAQRGPVFGGAGGAQPDARRPVANAPQNESLRTLVRSDSLFSADACVLGFLFCC